MTQTYHSTLFDNLLKLLFCPKFLLALIIILPTVYFYKISSFLDGIPMPPKLPFIGHLLDYRDETLILPNLTNRLHQYNGLIRQMVGPTKPHVVAANREFMQWVYQNTKYITKAIFYDSLKSWIGNGLISAPDGLQWKSRRQIMAPCFFKTSVLKSYLKTIDEKSDILVNTLNELHDQKIDIHTLCKKFILDVLLVVSMGTDINIQRNETEYYGSVAILVHEYNLRNRARSFLKFINLFSILKSNSKEQKALKIVDKHFEKALQQNELAVGKDNDNNENPCILNMLLKLKNEGKPFLTNEELRDEMNTLIFAGYDTTSVCLALTLYEIAANPRIQKKLIEEQRATFNGSLDNREINYEMFANMSYLDMVIKEILRLYSIVPFLGKQLTKDMKYGDILLPKHLNFALMPYALNRHPEYFEEPNKFIPERFENKKLLDPTIYIPFGVRPRECIGKSLALLALKCTISKILRNFELVDIAEHSLVLIPNVAVQSKTGIFIRIKNRK